MLIISVGFTIILLLVRSNMSSDNADSISNADKAILTVSNDLLYRINHECYCILNGYEYYHTVGYDSDFFNHIRLLISKHNSLLIIFAPVLFPTHEVANFPQEEEDIVLLFNKIESNRVISLILTHSTSSVDFLDNYWKKYDNCGLIDSLYLALEAYLIKHSYHLHNTINNSNNNNKVYECKDYNINTIMNEYESMEHIIFVDDSKYSYESDNKETNSFRYFRINNFIDNIRQHYNRSFYVHVPAHNVHDVIEYFPLANKCLFNDKIRYLMKQEVYYVSKNYSVDIKFANTSIVKVLNSIREPSSYITLGQYKIKVSGILNIIQGVLFLTILVLMSCTTYCGVLLGYKFDIIAYFSKINTNNIEKKHHK